jgi:chromosome segregation ATPase
MINQLNEDKQSAATAIVTPVKVLV